PILAVGAALTVAVAALIEWKRHQDDLEKVAASAKDAFKSYRVELELTDEELAHLDADTAAERFAQATDQVEAFKEALSERGVDVTVFDDIEGGVDAVRRALQGAESDLNRLKVAAVTEGFDQKSGGLWPD